MQRLSLEKLLDIGFEFKYGTEDVFNGAIQSCEENGIEHDKANCYFVETLLSRTHELAEAKFVEDGARLGLAQSTSIDSGRSQIRNHGAYVWVGGWSEEHNTDASMAFHRCYSKISEATLLGSDGLSGEATFAVFFECLCSKEVEAERTEVEAAEAVIEVDIFSSR
ncbi:hypothetical protein NL676_009613 [Syzygium grande]|nr:hypothetical protein NL676_009613 [Syzygium grande]